jgi:NADH:ubiquinone oxidoreductase subunit F (NADH-binding)
VTITADPPATARLLAALGAGAGPELAAHVALHGPLPVSRTRRHRDEHLLDELRRAGLTGRGGAGFPAARKHAVVTAQHRRPVLVVNAMEGEPASMKDRVLVERAPHLPLDGAELVATAVGAEEVVICAADDHPGTATALERALAERHRAGIGKIPMRLAVAPGHYAAGEESALADWVAGGRGLPTFRLDKSVPLTVRRRPVLLHNVETLAHAALIARHGADWFRQAGLPDAPGTALVTLTGAVARPGVLEVELGTPLADVLARAGLDERPQAVLLGGYGGAWLHGDDIGVAYAPAPLAALGAAVGAGVIGVLPPGACGLAETARIVAYLAGQSAGQCGPCVHGLPAVADDLRRLAAGATDARLLERLHHRFGLVEGRGACRLPDGAVRLARSALSVFADDVRAHAKGRPCPGWNHRGVLPVPGAERALAGR